MAIKYYSLGGQDERFRYSGVLELNGEIFILNAGGSCSNTMYDVEEVIPDYQTLLPVRKKLKGVFIGAPKYLNICSLPYLLEVFPELPIYTNSFGKAIIQDFFSEFEHRKGKKFDPKYIILDLISEYSISTESKVIPIKVASSLPHSLGWAFKFSNLDYVVFIDECLISSEKLPCRENQLDWLFKNLKGKTSLLIVGMQACSSIPSFALRTADNFPFLKKLVSRINKRLIAMTYSDDWVSLFNLSKIAYIYGYEFCIYPESLALLFNNFLEKNKLEEHAHSKKLRDDCQEEKVQLLVVTGTHKSLYERVRNIHLGRESEYSFKDDDVVIFLTHVYIERELEEIAVINELAESGGEVLKLPSTIQPYLAGAEDIMLLIGCLSPYNVVPVNGFYKDYVEFSKALENVMNTKKIYFLENGQIVNIERKNVEIVEQTVNEIYVGNQEVLELNKITLFEKKLLAQSGAILVSLRCNTKKNLIKLTHLELLYVFTSDFAKKEEVNLKIQTQLKQDLGKYLQHNTEIENKSLKQAVRKSVYSALDSYLHKKPAVLSIVSHLS